MDQGRREGEIKGEIKVFINLLTLKFGEITQSIHQRIQSANSAQISKWSGKLLKENHIDDVFK